MSDQDEEARMSQREEELIKAIGDIVKKGADSKPPHAGWQTFGNIVQSITVATVMFVASTVFDNSVKIASIEQKLEAAVDDRYTGKEAKAVLDRVKTIEGHIAEDELRFESLTGKLDGLIIKDAMQRKGDWEKHALVHEANKLSHQSLDSKISRYHPK